MRAGMPSRHDSRQLAGPGDCRSEATSCYLPASSCAGSCLCFSAAALRELTSFCRQGRRAGRQQHKEVSMQQLAAVGSRQEAAGRAGIARLPTLPESAPACLQRCDHSLQLGGSLPARPLRPLPLQRRLRLAPLLPQRRQVAIQIPAESQGRRRGERHQSLGPIKGRRRFAGGWGLGARVQVQAPAGAHAPDPLISCWQLAPQVPRLLQLQAGRQAEGSCMHISAWGVAWQAGG